MPVLAAIVGRPNVGKSSLFNRLLGERVAITLDEPGITRDRIYGRTEWLTKDLSIIDTGGIDIGDAPFLTQIKEQALLAIDEADVIIFVVDGQVGINDSDNFIAKILYKQNKPVILVVNKADNANIATNIYEFYALGFETVIPVSTIHGIGIGDLLDEVIKYDNPKYLDYDEDVISFSVVGRPNVGKSSLTNAILGENRVIVSDISGTTRDAIDTPFIRNDEKYVVIDTAGILKRGKLYENTLKYSVMRTEQALERADICLLVIDGFEGIIEQDKHVVSYIQAADKAIVVVVNKWDIVEKDEKTMKKMTDKIKDELKFISYAPIIFVSAKEGKRLNTIFDTVKDVYKNFNKTISTSTLNEVIGDATQIMPPASFNQGRAKFSYATQVAVKPPTFLLFVNNPDYVHFSYLRYLENQLRNTFELTGSPIKLVLRKKE